MENTEIQAKKKRKKKTKNKQAFYVIFGACTV